MLFRSDRKSTRLNSSHTIISYAVFCLKKKKKTINNSKLHHAHSTLLAYRTTHAPPLSICHSIDSCLVSFYCSPLPFFFFFFFNDRAPPEIYPLPLPDAFPI